MPNDQIEKFYPKSKAEWRKWLSQNHQSTQAVWLIYFKMSSNTPSITWSEAVDEALCFGWIDSTKKTIDDKSYMQYFSKRKSNSTWSAVNKAKVDQLIQQKQMTKAGLESIERAKQNGTWSLMDHVEQLLIPEDLSNSLNKQKQNMEFFQSQSKSTQKILLYWVASAKRAETRAKRISSIVESAAQKKKPPQFM